MEDTIEKTTKNVKAAKKTDRVTVRLNGNLGEAISEIQDITQIQTPSEVVRRALIVYHTLVMQKMAGNEPVVIQRGDDGEKPIPIFL